MQTTLVCFACGNELLISDQESGEIVCGYCGVVLAEREEDLAHDARTFFDDFKDGRRTGPRYSLSQNNKGFSTKMGRRIYVSGTLPEGSSIKLRDFGRIKVWDSRIRNSHEKGLRPAFHYLQGIRENLGLPDAVVERSAYFIRKASELGLTKGRTIVSITAASVYLACRESETPRSLAEVAKASNTDRRRLSKDYRLLLRTFNENLPVTSMSRCVTKIANMVGVSESKKRQAIELVNALESVGVSTGKSPLGFAASVIYLVCKNTNEERTQKLLAEVAGVTEVTIRNRYAELVKLITSRKVLVFDASLLSILAPVSVYLVVIAQHMWRHLPVIAH
ncbi:transcription initiation factor TFIIIB, Brf1 subunit/transcription initiation factor TFIIB [Candidatus Nitrososphaera evergladensis SR1]|uniref:Transcription initiation factor TFIIIB, Brf1 subunit/transcription initiation factor TFIIB n=2 Tax=Nitrososphaera TaxID=497726 RepID=A0A075MMN0_9ARCH|nr:transcription initiation factor TFIIIB, Brf1 subunit/transcription initiation factor TFIIB [Candidatus Nitrososphaera evergladensis SR1]